MNLSAFEWCALVWKHFWSLQLWQGGWELVGWTMCYFLATGAFVALVGALVRFAASRTAPHARYAISLTTLAILGLLPIGIAIWLAQSPQANVTLAAQAAPNVGKRVQATHQASPSQLLDSSTTTVFDLKYESLEQVPEPQLPAAMNSQRLLPTQAPRAPAVVDQPVHDAFPWGQRAIEFLPWLWVVGTPLTFLLLCTGLIGSQRLRTRSQLLNEGPIHADCEKIRHSLAISRNVAIAVNERIASPLLIGIVRPMILLPPAALTGWTTDELEMVLLHELAHVRRWDNLVNFMQRIVESLLFFHPCIWWVSRWVRTDREECCDAVVVAQTDQPQAYAELLVALATSQQPLAGLAMAQHPLAGRIRKILNLEEERMLVTRSTIGMAVLASASLLAVLVWAPVDTTVAEETNLMDVEKKKLTTEGTGRLVEKNIAGNKSYALPTDASHAEVQKTVAQLEAKGLDVYVRKNEDGSTVISGVKKKVPPTPVQPPSPVFLSLEDQRAADLAYKLLNTELAPPSEAGLKRVQAKKFSGGLLVTDINPSSTRGDTPNLLKKGDLLVGLHVWPTTSLADVREILERDDLKELSPLKFYVIRKTKKSVPPANVNEYSGGYGGEFGGGFGGPSVELVDELVSGRIAVKVDLIKPSQGLVRASESSADDPAANQLDASATANLRAHLAQVETRLLEAQADASAADLEAQRAEQLAEGGEIPALELRKASLKSKTAREVVKALEREVQAIEKEITTHHRQQTQLLYDNKTFDQWRALWKNELKTEKRTEAIKAMAAFGRAGYGKEAAEAILDVAGEYDFKMIDGSTVGKLKEQVLEVLNSENGQALGTALWLPELLQRYQANPEKWKGLASQALWRMSYRPTLDEYDRQRLFEVAKGDDAVLRNAALSGLAKVDVNDEELARIAEMLTSSDDTEKAKNGLYVTLYWPNGGFGRGPARAAQLRSLLAMHQALNHSDRDFRRLAREYARRLNEKDAELVNKKMLQQLHNANTDDKRIAAIRTLVALAKQDAMITENIEKLTYKKFSQKVRIAAAAAYMSMTTDKGEERLAAFKNFRAEGVDITASAYREEERLIFPPIEKTDGGGGGFF